MLLTFTILAITIAFFVWGKFPADLGALISLLVLFLAGLIDGGQALAGFSDPAVIMIAALFVVGEGLSRTGVTAWLGERMLGLAGSKAIRLLVVSMGGAALLSAFISNTGTVATLLPAVTAAAWRIGSLPAKFLLPLAYAANSGGLLTLTGTTPNIIVNETLIRAGFQPLGYFEFALIGLPLLVASVLYMVFLGRKLLPERRSGDRPVDISESMEELAEDYTLQDKLFWLRVRRGSRMVNQKLVEAGLGRDYNVSVVRVERPVNVEGEPVTPGQRRRQRVKQTLEQLQEPESSVPGAETVVHVDDVLLVKGTQEAVERVMVHFNVGVQPALEEEEELGRVLLSHEVGVAEVLIAPRSAYIGRTVIRGNFSEKFKVQVLSVRRGDEAMDLKKVRLRFGDAMLVRGRWQDIELLRNEHRNFVVVGSPEAMARQVVELSPQAVVAVVALLGMVVLMVTGLVPVVMAALLAAIVMVLGRCMSMEQAYRSVNWGSVVLIAAMIPMSIALQETGGADFLANGLVNSLGATGPLL
jgi:di/tricarboxylate transporter